MIIGFCRKNKKTITYPHLLFTRTFPVATYPNFWKEVDKETEVGITYKLSNSDNKFFLPEEMVVTILRGLQLGYTNHCYFICE